jgi:hypothetical protein
MLKYEWKASNIDYAAWNSGQVEDVRLDEYAEMLSTELADMEWDSDVETHVLE